MHSFQHRLRQARKTAHANAILLRSTTMSHGARIRLLQALVKPSLLYGVETWKLTPALLAKIIGAERAFSRWCMRLTNRAGTTGEEERDIAAWVQWQAESAGQIAKTTHKQQIERWHVTALRLHWKWAGKAAGNKGSLTKRRQQYTSSQSVEGDPKRIGHNCELMGTAGSWEQRAESKVQWLSFCDLFVDFVETQVLRADTRATLARDAVSIRQENTEQ
jgi:hypothetical protein